jgi:phosphoribosyl 1,2-cyclic phosphodiesterase
MPYVKFWGVRGSIPTPGPSTIRYGGNTPCVELRYNADQFFILDAGSGIREFGQWLLKSGKPVKSHVFISHMHWDHIQGIPFFTPAYIPGNEFTFYGAQEAGKDLSAILADQMNIINFPIEFKDMGSKLNFVALNENTFSVDTIEIETIYLNHPGFALGYKFKVKDTTIIYISDNEPYPVQPPSPGNLENPDQMVLIEDNNQRLVNYIKKADIFIHDAQYTPKEYKTKYQWGHSPYDYTVNIALQAQVETLVLFHHDPAHDDDFIDTILESAKRISWQHGSNMNILAAQEGMQLDFT